MSMPARVIIKADIVGATGYAGQEIVGLLLNHPDVRINNLYSTTDEPRSFGAMFPRFNGRTSLVVQKLDKKQIISGEASVVFLSMPHTCSMALVPSLIKAGKRVIDLGADFRIRKAAVYEKAYGVAHTQKDLIRQAVYGLPELYRHKIRKSTLVANPGCYPTAAILALAPVLSTNTCGPVIIDAKSGTTGAGKKAVQEMIFSEVDGDFRAYKVNIHQHMPEIEQELSRLAGMKTPITFVPHLLPLKRGILETIYVPVKMRPAAALALYRRFYKNEPFIRVRDEGVFPTIKDVAGTNFCDIGVRAEGSSVIIIAAIDNLLKGAAGQAVQNMNIMFGFPETTGLI